MAVITVSNLSKSYEPVDIFSGVSFSIPRRGRVAVVGPNGIGKSTLLRILAGEEAATEGSIQLARGSRLGYLPQEARFEARHSLWQECLEGLETLLAREEALKRLELQLGENPADEKLLARYGKLQDEFDRLGGYTYETRMRQVLTGLGFEERDHSLTLDKLSGGQRTRALLARLLLSQPDLLILDEPTNHLDIHAVEWLESYLRDWEGAVLIVSHDRYFLDRVVNIVGEMSPAGFETYRGNYSAYLHQRAERWEERQRFIETEKGRLMRDLEYVKKNLAGQNTSQAKGKLRRLSREVRAIEAGGWLATKGKAWHEYGSAVNTMKVYEVEARLKALAEPDARIDRSLKLRIRPKSRSGNIVLRGREFTIGYPTKSLFAVEELELRRLECAALIGPNGSGKTTFLRTLLGELPALNGELDLGASLKIGYFAQAHEDLNPNLTMIEEIDRVGTGMLEKEIRGYLGRFLFSGDDHYKPVSVLSGGERGRLALAKLSLLDANLLLLDEPSNHLDIPAQEVLQEVLAVFDGTILMVSHDRYLIDALASQVWEIDPNQERLTVFKGSYSEYKGIEQGQAQQEEKTTVTQRAVQKTRKEAAPQARPKRSKHEQQRLDAKIHALEDRILDLEQQLDEISQKLANPPDDPGEILSLSEDYAYIEAELAQAMGEWEELHAE